MKVLMFFLGMMISFAAAASDYEIESRAVEIRASEHTCAQMSQIIQHYGNVFVRMGLFGRSFRYPPYSCNLGDRYTTVSFRDMNGARCRMSYACERDPNSQYR